MFYDKEEKKKREERFLASQGFVVFFLGGAAATNQTAIYLLPIRRPEFRIANPANDESRSPAVVAWRGHGRWRAWKVWVQSQLPTGPSLASDLQSSPFCLRVSIGV
jgi:hypothetical protein